MSTAPVAGAATAGAGAAGTAAALQQLQQLQQSKSPQSPMGDLSMLRQEVASIDTVAKQAGGPSARFAKPQVQAARQLFGYDASSGTAILEIKGTEYAKKAEGLKATSPNQFHLLNGWGNVLKGVGQAQKYMVKTGWFSSQGKASPDDAIAYYGDSIAKGLEEAAQVATTTDEINSLKGFETDLGKLSPKFAAKYTTQLLKIRSLQPSEANLGIYTPALSTAA